MTDKQSQPPYEETIHSLFHLAQTYGGHWQDRTLLVHGEYPEDNVAKKDTTDQQDTNDNWQVYIPMVQKKFREQSLCT